MPPRPLLSLAICLLGRVTLAAPSASAVERRQFLCARIEIVTEGTSADADVGLDDDAPEGGDAQLFRNGGYARVTGERLGEAERARFDYYFFKNDLVCARETVTSIHTVLEQTSDGVPPYVRTDFRVFSHDEVVYSSVYRVPKHDDVHAAPTADETVRDAHELLERLSALAKKQRPRKRAKD